MTYEQTLEFLFSQLPMYQRVGAAAFRNNLDNTHLLDKILDHPHRNFKSIHVAGTNGKGSVSHMIAAALQTKGLKTGVYSSPHLIDFRERIKINGAFIPESYVIDFVKRHHQQFLAFAPSFFEITVGMAFKYFSDEKVDIAIIETGMGGRLDSTNIITPELSVITNISLEHKQFLGNTLPAIAREKAGIIKPGVPVVIGETHPETAPVFREVAEKNHSDIVFADRKLEARVKSVSLDQLTMDISRDQENVLLNLAVNSGARYQVKNIITALQSLEMLNGSQFEVTPGIVRESFAGFRKVSNFSGRWEVLQHEPLLISDSAHNPAGLQLLFSQISELSFSKKHLVIGMVSDKDVISSLGEMPADAIYYFCRPEVPRGLDAGQLAKEAATIGRNGNSFPSVKEALSAALRDAGTNDLIFAGGSTFVVAEVLNDYPLISACPSYSN